MNPTGKLACFVPLSTQKGFAIRSLEQKSQCWRGAKKIKLCTAEILDFLFGRRLIIIIDLSLREFWAARLIHFMSKFGLVAVAERHSQKCVALGSRKIANIWRRCALWFHTWFRSCLS